jgi:hypothetical protein
MSESQRDWLLVLLASHLVMVESMAAGIAVTAHQTPMVVLMLLLVVSNLVLVAWLVARHAEEVLDRCAVLWEAWHEQRVVARQEAAWRSRGPEDDPYWPRWSDRD